MIKCLLADDDEDDRDIFAIGLKHVHHKVELSTAENGYEALKLLAHTNNIPQYIFLDYNMPGMTGIDCLEQIRTMPHLQGIPVIIYSTSSNPVYEQRAQELQATHYLIKPVKIEVLAAVLDKLFNGEKLPFSLTEN